jgi:hypothetical protein
MAKVNSKHAQAVLSALIDGTDPKTGADICPDSVLQDVDIIRCLIAGREALASVQARTARRALLPKSVGTTWTEEEERDLVDAYSNGQPIDQIAQKHSRTIRAIEARLERLGLLTSVERTTSNRFTGELPPNMKKS